MAFIVRFWVRKIVVLPCFVALMALAAMLWITDTSPSLPSLPPLPSLPSSSPDHPAANLTVPTTSVLTSSSDSNCGMAGISPFSSAVTFGGVCNPAANKAESLTRGPEVQKTPSQDAGPFLEMLDKGQHSALVDQIEGCELMERGGSSSAEQAWCATFDQPEVLERLELALKRATHEGNLEANTLLAQLWLAQAKRAWARSALPSQQNKLSVPDSEIAMLANSKFQETLERIDVLLRNAGPGGNGPAPMYDSLVGAGYLKKPT